MSITDRLGQVLRDDDGVRLEFVRTYDADVREVWQAITDPDRMARWFGRWSGDPTARTVQVVVTAEGSVEPETVIIDECVPPHLLAVTMGSADGPWPLVVTLEQDGSGTRLRFVHHLAEPYDASAVGPGWHYYLDRFERELIGGTEPHWDDYYPALDGAYPVPAPPPATRRP